MVKLKNVKHRRRRKRLGLDDPKYLAWIRTKSCVACEAYLLNSAMWQLSRIQQTETEAHHAGDHGYAQKPSDRTAIPLCAEHHRTGKDAVHGPLGKKFWIHHNLDRNAVILRLNQEYDDLRT